MAQVLFLHEDVIASALTDALQSLLANANASRTFYTQVRPKAACIVAWQWMLAAPIRICLNNIVRVIL